MSKEALSTPGWGPMVRWCLALDFERGRYNWVVGIDEGIVQGMHPSRWPNVESALRVIVTLMYSAVEVGSAMSMMVTVWHSIATEQVRAMVD